MKIYTLIGNNREEYDDYVEFTVGVYESEILAEKAKNIEEKLSPENGYSIVSKDVHVELDNDYLVDCIQHFYSSIDDEIKELECDIRSGIILDPKQIADELELISRRQLEFNEVINSTLKDQKK